MLQQLIMIDYEPYVLYIPAFIIISRGINKFQLLIKLSINFIF